MIGSALALATAGAADYYVGRDGTEYAPGYQPADSYLVHRPDGVPVSDAKTASRPYSGPAPAAPTPFRTTATLREYKTGAEFAVFGGIDFAQDGSWKWDNADGVAGANLRASNRDKTGFLFGVKAGYTWPGFGHGPGMGEPGTPSVDGSKLVFLPSVEYEFLYLNRSFEAKGGISGAGGPTGYSGDVKANMDAYVFSLNPVLRAQIGMFRPYVGAGFGGAYLVMNHPNISAINSAGVVTGTDSGGNENELVFSWQIEAGADVFVTKNISLFGEYKFLNFVDPTFGGFKSEGMLSENIATAGIRYHF